MLQMSMTAMMSMPDSTLSMDMENGKSKGDKAIFRQRLTHEQVDKMQKVWAPFPGLKVV